MNKTKVILLCFMLTSYAVSAQRITGEVELCGFILGQYRKAVHTELGPPQKRIDTDDHWIYEFHIIQPDTSVYGLFKYSSRDTLSIYSIQINGKRYDEMRPFLGLKLGDSSAEVNKRLGTFNVTDTIDDPIVVVQDYENKNYSVEIDESGRLYGIQIFGSILYTKPSENVASIDGFVNAIRKKNVDSLLLTLMPNIEVYANHKVITYTGAARAEFYRKDSELVNYLLGKNNSVWYALEKEKTEITPELRIYGEKKMPATVFKFYKSKVISEIVFIPHAGRWKVYEISFRE